MKLNQYNKKIVGISLIASASLLLSACGGFFDKDNTPTPTPLASFKQEVTPRLRWSASMGGGASSNDYLKLNPVLDGDYLYASSTSGYVSAIHKDSGKVKWQTRVPASLSTGPGAGENTVVVANHDGQIFALDQTTGVVRWKATIPGNVIAAPAIGDGLVVIKTVSGLMSAYSLTSGDVLWSNKQIEPSLLLRGSSTPLIQNHALLVGYANGNLAKIDLESGQLSWLQTIAVPQGAFAIQRMIDIDANPVVYNRTIYVATYQGNIASLDWTTGKAFWTNRLSSYTGMAVNASSVYITDANGLLYAFNATTGQSQWRQNQLEYRTLSSPAIQGRYVVVGDQQGYMHWLSQADGHIAGRAALDSAIYADPIVDGNVLFTLTNKGTLSAYSIN